MATPNLNDQAPDVHLTQLFSLTKDLQKIPNVVDSFKLTGVDGDRYVTVTGVAGPSQSGKSCILSRLSGRNILQGNNMSTTAYAHIISDQTTCAKGCSETAILYVDAEGGTDNSTLPSMLNDSERPEDPIERNNLVQDIVTPLVYILSDAILYLERRSSPQVIAQNIGIYAAKLKNSLTGCGYAKPALFVLLNGCSLGDTNWDWRESTKALLESIGDKTIIEDMFSSIIALNFPNEHTAPVDPAQLTSPVKFPWLVPKPTQQLKRQTGQEIMKQQVEVLKGFLHKFERKKRFTERYLAQLAHAVLAKQSLTYPDFLKIVQPKDWIKIQIDESIKFFHSIRDNVCMTKRDYLVAVQRTTAVFVSKLRIKDEASVQQAYQMFVDEIKKYEPCCVPRGNKSNQICILKRFEHKDNHCRKEANSLLKHLFTWTDPKVTGFKSELKVTEYFDDKSLPLAMIAQPWDNVQLSTIEKILYVICQSEKISYRAPENRGSCICCKEKVPPMTEGCGHVLVCETCMKRYFSSEAVSSSLAILGTLGITRDDQCKRSCLVCRLMQAKKIPKASMVIGQDRYPIINFGKRSPCYPLVRRVHEIHITNPTNKNIEYEVKLPQFAPNHVLCDVSPSNGVIRGKFTQVFVVSILIMNEELDLEEFLDIHTKIGRKPLTYRFVMNLKTKPLLPNNPISKIQGQMDTIPKETSPTREVRLLKLHNGKSFYEKRIEINHLNKLSEETALNFEYFKREVQLTASVPHDNLVSLAGYSIDLKEGFSQQTCYLSIITPNEGDQLEKFLAENALTDDEKRSISLQIAAGMKHLHKKKIIHRDLKPHNIVISRVNSEFVVKIIDFGISKKSARLNTAGIGTESYMAPEVKFLSLITPSKSNYTLSVDVYSYGLVLYRIWTGLPIPYSVIDLRYPSSLHYIIRTLISKCISSDPTHRPSFKEIEKTLQLDLGNSSLQNSSGSPSASRNNNNNNTNGL